jgi:hypothetical protein
MRSASADSSADVSGGMQATVRVSAVVIAHDLK